SEGDDDGLFLCRQDCRSGLLGSCRQVGNTGPRFPLGDGLLIDSIALGQSPQALLTMLYRSTDRLCRCGAPMKNLSHSASFESLDKNAPLKSGTKQLLSGPASPQMADLMGIAALTGARLDAVVDLKVGDFAGGCFGNGCPRRRRSSLRRRTITGSSSLASTS